MKIHPEFQEEWDAIQATLPTEEEFKAREKDRFRREKKKCPSCKKNKQVMQFYWHNGSPAGSCKACRAKRRKERIAAGLIDKYNRVLIPTICSPSFPRGPKHVV